MATTDDDLTDFRFGFFKRCKCLLKLFFKFRDPVLIRQVLHLEWGNACLKFRIFKLKIFHIILDLRIRHLEFYMKRVRKHLSAHGIIV